MKDVSEDDGLLPISALQHLVFCERQCALIHIERIWVENELTAEGRLVHERADRPGLAVHGRVARALELRSSTLGLVGRADVVWFIVQPGLNGSEVPFPVEYKRGRASTRAADRIQLCAQGIALEEMTGAEVPRGALFYYRSRRRVAVEFTPDLRRETERCAARLHDMFRHGTLPKASLEPKCRNCSLRDDCQPVSRNHLTVRSYVESIVQVHGGVRAK